MLKKSSEPCLLRNVIGIFDSGSGGLTVLRALRARAPMIDVVYFGDLANMPYGGKSQAELQRLTLDAMGLLRREGADHLVSACNSVSASVIRPMMELFGAAEYSVTEMVGPAVRAVLEVERDGIVVLATVATIESGIYQRAFAENGVTVAALAVPGLADAIEFGDESRTRQLILEIAMSLERVRPRVVVLACTHYPLVINRFRKLFGSLDMDSVHIFDPADAVATEVIARCGVEGYGKTRIIVTAENETFIKRVEEFDADMAVLVRT